MPPRKTRATSKKAEPSKKDEPLAASFKKASSSVERSKQNGKARQTRTTTEDVVDQLVTVDQNVNAKRIQSLRSGARKRKLSSEM